MVQSAETGGNLERRFMTLSVNRDSKYSIGLFAMRKFESVVHIGGERMEVDGGKR
jgi:hypothetical protein